jgi:kinetochore protein Mis13/DSN1
VELPSRRTLRGSDAHTEVESRTNSGRSRNNDTSEGQPEAKKTKKGRPPKSKTTQVNGYASPEQPPAGTKVALPMADTPVIQRNKEFRGGKADKGKRRSSLSMRGRRASSLIDSGASNGMVLGLNFAIDCPGANSNFIALPHREVGTADFFKHIADGGLPEPRRMRQLLIWCATRAIGEKPTGGSDPDEQSARLAGKLIHEAYVKRHETDFSSAPNPRRGSSRILKYFRALKLV